MDTSSPNNNKDNNQDLNMPDMNPSHEETDSHMDNEDEGDDSTISIINKLSPSDKEAVRAYATSILKRNNGGDDAADNENPEGDMGDNEMSDDALMEYNITKEESDNKLRENIADINKFKKSLENSPFSTPQFEEEINEDAVNISAQAKGDNLSDYTTAITSPDTQSDIQKAKAGGNVSVTISGPNSNDSQPEQVVNVAQGQSIQNAMSSQANDALIRNGGKVKLTGDGINENTVFLTKEEFEGLRKKGLPIVGITTKGKF